MPGKHAVLSASSSKQWLHCPPSARLQENFPNESSVYAEEGTWAHELCEYKVKKYLHERKKRPQSEFFTEEIDRPLMFTRSLSSPLLRRCAGTDVSLSALWRSGWTFPISCRRVLAPEI